MQSLRGLVTAGGVALIACCFAGMAPNYARAQDAGSQTADWQASGPPSEVSQPAKAGPPLYLAGCWYGGLDDNSLGSGSGFLYFVQNGKKLVNGTTAGLYFSSYSTGGGLTGKTNSKTFHLKFHKKQCNVSFHGTIDSSGDLTGMYHLSKKCAGFVLDGTFDFTFDPSNQTC
jgi:hypothetical protein